MTYEYQQDDGIPGANTTNTRKDLYEASSRSHHRLPTKVRVDNFVTQAEQRRIDRNNAGVLRDRRILPVSLKRERPLEEGSPISPISPTKRQKPNGHYLLSPFVNNPVKTTFAVTSLGAIAAHTAGSFGGLYTWALMWGGF